MSSLIKAINRFISKIIYVLLFDLFNGVILNYEPQWATKTHSDLQLRHKMNKTHKNLHSLVNELSPLNPLTAGKFPKISPWKNFETFSCMAGCLLEF